MNGCHFPREASERLGNQVAGQLFDAVAKDQADPSPAKPSR
jgi:hypothetical protein